MYPMLLVVWALLTSGQNPVLVPLEQHALDVAQHVSARALGRTLADNSFEYRSAASPDTAIEDTPFADWFKALVGDSSKVTWKASAYCGEGEPRSTPRDLPMCVEAVANLTPTRRVVVQIIVGIVAANERAWLWSAAILDGNDVKSFKRLSELAMAIRAK
jgi:hypothetical protein